MPKEHTEKCLRSLLLGNYKTTMRYNVTPIRMNKIKKTCNTKCWLGCEQLKLWLCASCTMEHHSEGTFRKVLLT